MKNRKIGHVKRHATSFFLRSPVVHRFVLLLTIEVRSPG